MTPSACASLIGKLLSSVIMASESAQGSMIYFVVPSEHRKQGVAHELLAAAVDFAKSRGPTLREAYPVDRDAPHAPNAPWFGSRSMFAKAGFAEVARHKPARPIVRLRVARNRIAGA
jgi:GNAT superfamily N-acetyltransferase